ncbi:hypothetical protein D3C84_1010240 [compost metagenome]
MGSGSRYLGSGWISSFSQFVPSASRARWAANTASAAVLAPEVLGSNLTPSLSSGVRISS